MGQVMSDEEFIFSIPSKPSYEELERLYNQSLKDYDEATTIIDKAIKYLKTHSSGVITENAGIVYVTPTTNVLEILEGDSNE